MPDHEVYRLNMTASYNVLEAAEINGIEKICMASSVNALGNKPGLARGVHALRAGAMALKDSYTAYPNTADSLLSHKSLMALARGPPHPHAGADWGDKIAPEYFPIDEGMHYDASVTLFQQANPEGRRHYLGVLSYDGDYNYLSIDTCTSYNCACQRSATTATALTGLTQTQCRLKCIAYIRIVLFFACGVNGRGL